MTEIKVKGKKKTVPSAVVQGRRVIAGGRLLKVAEVQDEGWLAGQAVAEPAAFLADLRRERLKADIFTFTQKLPDTRPKYAYHLEWDNVAAIPITTYQDWWENRLPQVARKNIRRAVKRGVTARVAEFDDELVRGIVEIHNDTPTRQGVPFSHYGKEFEVVKKDYASFPGRSEFIAAYFGNELIGIIKLIYMGEVAGIMQIISKTAHYDKRPTNILIGKAVEVCEQKKIPFLIYGKYIYGKKTQSSLTEFKARNGFEKIDLPQYYIPLTLKGRIAIRLKLHLGLLGILPVGVINFLRDMRSRYIHLKLRLQKPAGCQPASGGGELAEAQGDEV